MKNIKTLILFLAIFGLIFTFLNIKITPAQKSVLNCQSQDINKIVFKETLNDTDEIILEPYSPKSQTWLLRSENSRLFADTEVVEKLRSLLCHLNFVENFEKSTPEQLKDFGLTSPRRTIELNDSTNTTLHIGSDTPSTTEFYVNTLQNPENVFLVTNSLLPHLMVRIPDLMERHLFDRLKDGGTLVIHREGQADIHLTTKENTKSQDEIISALRAQLFNNYQGPLTQEKTLDYGMSLPDFTIEWTRPDGSQTTYRFSFFGEKYYLCIQLGNSYYALILEPSAAIELWKRVNEFRN